MKDIFKFIRWQWNKFEFWQKCWIVSMTAFGAGITQDGVTSKILIAIPMLVIFSFALKWFIWDRAIESWKEYKEEKSSLFEKIKTSDQK